MALVDMLALDELQAAILPWFQVSAEKQSVALAERYGLTGAARFYVGLRDGRTILRVRSRTDSLALYEVTYSNALDSITHCTCQAGALGRPCFHKGAGRAWVERMKLRAAHYAKYGNGYDC